MRDKIIDALIYFVLASIGFFVPVAILVLCYNHIQRGGEVNLGFSILMLVAVMALYESLKFFFGKKKSRI